MRLPFALLIAVILASCLTPLHADQNPAPTNVGLYRYVASSVTASSSTVQILTRNSLRAGLVVQNNGSVSIVVKAGSAVTSATDGVVLTAGSRWEPSPPPVDALYAWPVPSSSTVPVVLMEFVK